MIFTFLFFYFFSARSADALPPPSISNPEGSPLGPLRGYIIRKDISAISKISQSRSSLTRHR